MLTQLDKKIKELSAIMPGYAITATAKTRRGKESKRGSEIKITALKKHPQYGDCLITFQTERFFLQEDFAMVYIKRRIILEYRYAVRKKKTGGE